MKQVKHTDCTVELNLRPRVKGRAPVWGVRIFIHQDLVFDDRWLALRAMTQHAAQWLADLVLSAITQSLYLVPRGHQLSNPQLIKLICAEQSLVTFPEWVIRDGSDAFAACGPFILRAEHLDGPLNGGVWWVAVFHSGVTMNTPPRELRFKRITSAQWVAELMALTFATLDVISTTTPRAWSSDVG